MTHFSSWKHRLVDKKVREKKKKKEYGIHMLVVEREGEKERETE